MKVKMERDLFGSILFFALQRNIDMGEMLKFPLTPVPICLAHIDGSMQKTPKSSLLKELETQVISETSSNIDSLVIDDMFFLRLLKELPETFGLLAKSILKEVCAVSNAHRIDLIFDKTILQSIHDSERDKRYQNESRQIMYETTGPEQKRPNNFQDALFKKALVKIKTSTWREEKDVTILQNKELRVNCEDICFLYLVEKRKMRKT